jgi:elongator complex protein 1
MRNLRNTKHTAIQFEGHVSPLTATAWDGNHVICAFGPSPADPAITLKRFSASAWKAGDGVTIASWDAPCPNPDLPSDRILNLHTFPESGSISLVLEGGDIIVVRDGADLDPGTGDLIEIVGSVDAGISAAQWSPDEELLTIATKANTLLFMTRDFEGTASIDLTPEDLNVSNHVSVGWGKKETQFQGPQAKAKLRAMQDPTVPQHVDEGRLSANDDERTAISWRGDGQYVAINTILETPDLKRRVVRVYTREGVLDSVSEPVNGLEGALSWKPSGQLIAGIQRTGDRIDVVFFERNGLRHGEFTLRLTPEEMEGAASSIALDWNSDSSVLAVSLKDRVQFWTMGNYHYYLKQEILLGEQSGSIMHTQWHPEKALQVVCHGEKSFRLLSYSFEVSRGSVVPPSDHGTVAVIDGRKLKITPLRVANVPPPMAFDEIELPENAIDVAVDRTGMRIAVLHVDRVSILSCNYGAKPAEKAVIIETLRLEAPPGTAGRQLLFDHEDIITISSTQNTRGTRIETVSKSGTSHIHLDHQISYIFQPTNHDRILFENEKGAILDLKSQALVGTLPATCPHVEVWQGEEASIFFGLTTGGTLHIHSDLEKRKITGCTSFVVTATHLIYSTSNHLLKFVHLHDTGELAIPLDEPEKDERCRNIERGAKLVTVTPSAYSLVLQMPRGNLETIYPRALVLSGIRHELGRREYKKAFLICRKQRVDMNILHDYAPEQFMSHVDLVVKQLKKVEYIDLVLSSLSEEDVSQTIYKDTINSRADKDALDGMTFEVPTTAVPTPSISKINKICDAFLKVLSGHTETHLQSTITAHVCKNPPDLEAGLSLVSELRKCKEQARLEDAVSHICFLADVNQLYDTALGIYDLDVALLVAQQSQKDPREYLPYLQRLQDMEPLRQRFAIDNDLKRYPKALGQLHALDAFDEVKSYAAKHELYTQAIELYRYDNARLLDLMRIYADFLSSRNRYKEAGIAYEYIGDFASAFENYRSTAGLWRECLTCAALVEMEDTRIADVARDLAEACEESKDYTSAATIHLEYLDDLPTAIATLCKAFSFADAIRLAARHRQPSLLTSTIDPGLIDASATLTELLADMRTQLHHQLPRLRDLRHKKLLDPMSFLDSGADAPHPDIPDDISLAPTDATTSAGTFMTRYTHQSTGTLATNATRKTHKNRRREERKRARGKKGTVYEEEYLVSSVERLMVRLNETADDQARVVEGLMRRGMRERAVAVEAAFAEVWDMCRGCVSEVFGAPTGVGGDHDGGMDGLGGDDVVRPVGGQAVLLDAVNASRLGREAPVLKKLERLGLLGSNGGM